LWLHFHTSRNYCTVRRTLMFGNLRSNMASGANSCGNTRATLTKRVCAITGQLLPQVSLVLEKATFYSSLWMPGEAQQLRTPQHRSRAGSSLRILSATPSYVLNRLKRTVNSKNLLRLRMKKGYVGNILFGTMSHLQKSAHHFVILPCKLLRCWSVY
jgi:hypothetical protein